MLANHLSLDAFQWQGISIIYVMQQFTIFMVAYMYSSAPDLTSHGSCTRHLYYSKCRSAVLQVETRCMVSSKERDHNGCCICETETENTILIIDQDIKMGLPQVVRALKGNLSVKELFQRKCTGSQKSIQKLGLRNKQPVQGRYKEIRKGRISGC
ncbi:hypothetical protein AKJ16_DCAP20105 [Drosera capensis]